MSSYALGRLIYCGKYTEESGNIETISRLDTVKIFNNLLCNNQIQVVM